MAEAKKQVYNKFVTKEKWAKVNSANKGYMEDYIMELVAQQKKDSTIAQYKNDLKIILVYVLEELNNNDITDLTRKNFRKFTIDMTNKGMSNARVNRLLSALRTFLTYLSEDDETDYDFNSSRIKGLPKEEVRDIVFIDDEDVLKLFDSFMSLGKYREALALGILYDTGARRNEILQISRSVIKKNTGVTNTVIGKRGKKFKLTYGRLTREAFAKLEEKRTDDYDCLFLNREGNPMDSGSFYNMVSGFIKPLSVLTTKDYTGLNVHTLRHSYIQNLKDGTHYYCREIFEGALPLDKIQLLAHHSDISTTQGYCKDESESEIAALFGLDADLLER